MGLLVGGWGSPTRAKFQNDLPACCEPNSSLPSGSAGTGGCCVPAAWEEGPSLALACPPPQGSPAWGSKRRR